MRARLIKGVWADTDRLPEGLTLNKEYEVIKVFNQNPVDKYFRILDDNNEEQAWNSDLFEVTANGSKRIL